MATTQLTGNASDNTQALVPIQQDLSGIGIPRDIFVQIFSRLSRGDVVVCPVVCKDWDQLFGEEVVWRNLLENHFPFYTIPKEIQGFKKAYKDQRLLKYNLTNGVCTSHTLQGHTGWVFSLAISGDKLISGSNDGTIKIWDLRTNNLRTNTCLTTLQWHRRDTIRSLAISRDKLISGSSDNTTKIWKFDAKHTVVFEELARLLESPDEDLIQQAMDRFSRMPKAAKHQIYGELYKILKPLNLIQNDYWGCAEHAFHNIHGQSSTPLQRAQAIRNYVSKQP
jgi:hypothetical protein